MKGIAIDNSGIMNPPDCFTMTLRLDLIQSFFAARSLIHFLYRFSVLYCFELNGIFPFNKFRAISDKHCITSELQHDINALHSPGRNVVIVLRIARLRFILFDILFFRHVNHGPLRW